MHPCRPPQTLMSLIGSIAERGLLVVGYSSPWGGGSKTFRDPGVRRSRAPPPPGGISRLCTGARFRVSYSWHHGRPISAV
eukprot:scaffold1446_cov391-Prasinococcus_capsulatus_cf.AAC.8